MQELFRKYSELNRRDFISFSAKAFLGVGLMPWAVRSEAFAGELQPLRVRARNVIYLYMAGGMSHLDTFDPKPGTDEQGPVQTIDTNVAGVKVSEHFPRLAKHMDKVALIRSLSSTQGAHEQGNYFMHSSYTQRGTIQHPGLGAWLVKLDGRVNRTLPGAVQIGSAGRGTGAGFLESRYSPLVIGNPEEGLKNSQRPKQVTEGQFQDRLMLANAFDTEFHKRYNSKKVRAYTEMYDDALKLMKSQDLEAFNLNKEAASVREAYGKNPFGQGCILARRLVENDVRFVEVTLGGWDTHQNNFENVGARATILDQALSSLLTDLDRRGMLEETMVVVATEFGRTPEINENSGRDHAPAAFSCLLAGGGIRGGVVYGSTDRTGKKVKENKVQVPDFNATIAYGLGLPLEKVIYSPSKRPFTVAHKGKPITELFG